jgi:hypothetical protein
MHVRPPDLGGAQVSRRAFLGCCSALILASSGCAHLASKTRTAYGLITDPPLGDYQPILDALIEAILPGPGVDFPVTAVQVRTRLQTLFPLETGAAFAGAQRAFVLFDQTDLFAHALTPRHLEEVSLDASERGLDPAAALALSHARDAESYALFSRSAPTPCFRALSLERRREYLDLWRASGYVIRRQFYASARSLVMVATYSMDAVWPLIAYDGPLRGEPRR